ncbi:MAG: Ig-like domain-containing protein, partial [Patescibacteria group bacterium]
MLKHLFGKKRNKNEDTSLNEMDAVLRSHAYSIIREPREGFKQALKHRLHAARATQPMSSKLRVPFNFKRLSVGLVPAVAVIVIVVLLTQPLAGVKTVYAQDAFTLTPEVQDALGVESTTAFILESKEKVSVSDIEKLLVVDSAMDQTPKFEQLTDYRIRITFEKPLTSDEIVKFRLATLSSWPTGEEATRNYNWAFQVKGDFHVTSMIPGDKSSGVPLDSGIEFNFNYENVRAEDFEKALTISPATTGHVETSRRTFVFVPDALKAETVYTVTLSKDLGLVGSDETLGEDVVVQFETSGESRRGASFDFRNRYLNVVPGDTVALPYYAYREGENPTPLHVNVYAFDSYEAYVTAMQTAEDVMWRQFASLDELLDTKTHSPVMTFDAPLFTEVDQPYLVFPEPLAEGYYMVQVNFAGHDVWALIASTPVTAYAVRGVDETIVW